MLPRSTELQKYDTVELWLKDNLCMINDDFILIIHNYIPSIASAFAYAEPANRIVKIQSLWDNFSISSGFLPSPFSFPQTMGIRRTWAIWSVVTF